MKLTNVFFCDDIRFETKNKLSLMGLYDDRMVYPKNIQWPIPTRLATLFRFRLDNEKTTPKAFVLRYFIKDKELIKIEGEISTAGINELNETANLIVSAEGLMIMAGDLGYTIKILDKDGNEVLSQTNKHALKIIEE